METKWGKWVYVFDNNYPRKYKGINNEDCFCDLTDVRYVLGEEFVEKEGNGEKALICIGLNPSTAVPRNLDNTLCRVRKYAVGRYNAWFMLNIYPFRETDSELIPQAFEKDIAEKNLIEINNLTNLIEKADVWCAWGNGVDSRQYLKDCLRDILDHLQAKKGYHFVQKIPTEKPLTAHPLHPIASIKCETELGDFDINEYIKKLKNQ